MPSRPSFFDYVAAAFNARPMGMFVAPNWVGLAAFGLLGIANPGFWVLGAGLELGYLLTLATNGRFQRVVAAQRGAANGAAADWNARVQKVLERLEPDGRRSYQALAERCRSIIELQVHGATEPPHGLDAQADGLGRLSWMFLRLLLARQTIRTVLGDAGAETLERRRTALRLQQDDPGLSEELRRSIGSQVEILGQRIQQRTDGERRLEFIEAELARIEQQVELIREQAALSTDPELLSRRIDEIAASLGTTGQWIREQQQVFGAMEDLLTEPPPLSAASRAKESQ